MMGFVFGTFCLVALTKVAFGRRRFGWHAGRRWGRHFGGHCGRSGGGHFGWHALHSVMERLNTSPGQEKAIRAALRELMDTLRSLKPELQSLREDLGAAFRQDGFQLAQAEDLLSSRDTTLERARSAVAVTVTRIHDALDNEQREGLGRLLADGPRAWC